MTSSSPKDRIPDWLAGLTRRARPGPRHRAGARRPGDRAGAAGAVAGAGFHRLLSCRWRCSACSPSFPGRCRRCCWPPTITAIGLGAGRRAFADFAWPQLAGRARGGWSATAALPIARSPKAMTAAGGRAIPLRDGAVARCTRRAPARTACVCAWPAPDLAGRDPQASASGAADRCWRRAWCVARGDLAARLIARLRQRRRRRRHPGCLGRSAALYRPAADLSARRASTESSRCRWARC